MKSIYTVNKKVIFSFLVVFVCSTLSTFAQGEPDFGDDVLDNPPPVAPIDFWILPMVLMAMFYAYSFLKKRNVRIKN